MPNTTASANRKRSYATAAISLDNSPKSKRQRAYSGSIEQIDLVAEDEAEAAKAEKLRKEHVKRQLEESGKTVRLSDVNCMICMERFTNMSVTHCGKQMIL